MQKTFPDLTEDWAIFGIQLSFEKKNPRPTIHTHDNLLWSWWQSKTEETGKWPSQMFSDFFNHTATNLSLSNEGPSCHLVGKEKEIGICTCATFLLSWRHRRRKLLTRQVHASSPPRTIAAQWWPNASQLLGCHHLRELTYLVLYQCEGWRRQWVEAALVTLQVNQFFSEQLGASYLRIDVRKLFRSARSESVTAFVSSYSVCQRKTYLTLCVLQPRILRSAVVEARSTGCMWRKVRAISLLFPRFLSFTGLEPQTSQIWLSNFCLRKRVPFQTLPMKNQVLGPCLIKASTALLWKWTHEVCLHAVQVGTVKELVSRVGENTWQKDEKRRRTWQWAKISFHEKHETGKTRSSLAALNIQRTKQNKADCFAGVCGGLFFSHSIKMSACHFSQDKIREK